MDKTTLAAIHQPTFFPWMGYFDKIIRSDFFVVLDNVQYPKKGGSWCNRVKIMMNGKPNWVTMPIIRSYSGTKNINEIRIDNSKNWNVKLIKTMEVNYGRSPYFGTAFPLVGGLLEDPGENISDLNMKIIRALCEFLEIRTTHFIPASSLKASGSATDLLISIIKQTGAHAYLCGGGAAEYQEDEKFKENGINLIYQNFNHPIYPQFHSKEFVPGLSMIDLIMNCGKRRSIELINYQMTKS